MSVLLCPRILYLSLVKVSECGMDEACHRPKSISHSFEADVNERCSAVQHPVTVHCIEWRIERVMRVISRITSNSLLVLAAQVLQDKPASSSRVRWDHDVNRVPLTLLCPVLSFLFGNFTILFNETVHPCHCLRTFKFHSSCI